MRHVKIFFQVLGEARFKVWDNGGELEDSYFEELKDASEDVENREAHYLSYAVRLADKVTVESLGVNVQ